MLVDARIHGMKCCMPLLPCMVSPIMEIFFFILFVAEFTTAFVIVCGGCNVSHALPCLCFVIVCGGCNVSHALPCLCKRVCFIAAAKYAEDVSRFWNAFYKRNETRFFKDRYVSHSCSHGRHVCVNPCESVDVHA
jgi:hypothetical protein